MRLLTFFRFPTKHLLICLLNIILASSHRNYQLTNLFPLLRSHMHCSRCQTDFCYGCGKLKHRNGSSTCNGPRINKAQAKLRAREDVERLMRAREERRTKEVPLDAEAVRVRCLVEDIVRRVSIYIAGNNGFGGFEVSDRFISLSLHEKQVLIFGLGL